MNKKEKMQINEQLQNIYSGILFHNQEFAVGAEEKIQYDFSCPEFAQLREKYGLEEIAGKGSDFTRAKRLLHYLAPRLTHHSMYDNHVPCNALDLLEYSLNNPEQGINCLNKSKILAECCLAVGIFARRVSIMPFSPYDFDNHVVTEIFDRRRKKWIMLDPSTDLYMIDENKTPLSLLEIRHCFANDRYVTCIGAVERGKSLDKVREKYAQANWYICKNCFYFNVEQDNRFGPSERWLTVCPTNYSIKEGVISNMKYRINHLPEEYREQWGPFFQEKLEKLKEETEPIRSSVDVMRRAPEK